MTEQVLDFLLTRRSQKPALMTAPGPDAGQLETMLTAASRVPDHKKLAPWRFVVFEGAARARFGAVLADACAAEEREPPSPTRLELERGRFQRAPLVVAVISSVVTPAPAPEWEQVLSAGAATFNLCLAANAMGFATAWITEWYTYSPRVQAALDLKPGERIAGFVYVGTVAERQGDRDRPDLTKIVTRWAG